MSIPSMLPPTTQPYGAKGPLIMGITWAEASLAIILMLLRTYTNAFIIKSFKWDYFFALLTLVSGLVAQGMLTVSVDHGLGNHIFALQPNDAILAGQWSWIAQIIAIHAIGFGKIAIIAFLLRIQDGANSNKNKILVYFLYFVGISNVILNINQVIMILVACDPAEKLWNIMLPGNCDHILRTNYVGYLQGAWASASDVCLAIYPVLVFWNLKISSRVKIGLCLLMAGGLVAAVAGVAKTVYIKLISVSDDVTYAISPLVIWAFTEQWLVLILASLPPLRPFFITAFRRISSTVRSSHGHKSTGYYQHSDRKSIPMYPPSRNMVDGKNTDRQDGLMDNESERKILPDGPGILRTTRVQVDSGPRAGEAEDIGPRVGEADDSDESVMGMERGKAY